MCAFIDIWSFFFNIHNTFNAKQFFLKEKSDQNLDEEKAEGRKIVS